VPSQFDFRARRVFSRSYRASMNGATHCRVQALERAQGGWWPAAVPASVGNAILRSTASAQDPVKNFPDFVR
jgi:hypothetical protein